MFTNEIEEQREIAIEAIRTLSGLTDAIERVIAREMLDDIQAILDDAKKELG